MPDPLDYLSKKTQQLEEQFSSQYPQLFEVITQNKLLDSSTVKLSQTQEPSPTSAISAPEKKLLAQFSFEEHQSIIQKMQDIVRLPPGQLDAELELYLEQQLSDMLGFSITSELKGHRLPHSSGTIKGLPHTKASPTDTLDSHRHVLEAGFSNKRSVYGWVKQEYYITLPFFELKNWYKDRTVLLVNPVDSCAVAAVVTDVLTTSSNKYQFGGSPELIRAGKFWSPQATGKALIFFIEEGEEITLGPIDLGYKPS